LKVLVDAMLGKFWGKTKLIFYALLFQKHSRTTGLKISDKTVNIEEFTSYDA